MIRDIYSKAVTLGWYLRRPPLYRELGRRIAGWRLTTTAVRERLAREQAAGTAWCESVTVSLDEALAGVGIPLPLRRFETEQAALYDESRRAVEACPVRMGGPASLDLLYHLTLALAPARVVETGVANGWSSLAVLAALEVLGRGELASVDMPYAKLDNDRWVGVAVPARLRARWQLIRLPDRDGIPVALARGPIDLAHYDSDKSVEGREYAYPRLYGSLRPGGLLVSDDVGDNLAFRDFAARHGLRPWVVRKPAGDYAGIVRVPTHRAA